VKPNSFDELHAGRTTKAEVVKKLGNPFVECQCDEQPDAVEMATYTTGFDKQTGRHADAQFSTNGHLVFFRDGVYVGHAYYSSYESDHTDFDVQKLSQIAVGVTTREQLYALLGPPCGWRVHPGDAVDRPSGVEYVYFDRRRNAAGLGHDYKRWLSVRFGPDERVSFARYSTGYDLKAADKSYLLPASIDSRGQFPGQDTCEAIRPARHIAPTCETPVGM
jgi:hypothetical protein